MSSIPYNYRKYIDDVTKMTQRGHVSSGEQEASPSSAGSRGLAKTQQFTNNPTQMTLGQSEGMTPMAESMVEIRSILNRIDGVNAPAEMDPGELNKQMDTPAEETVAKEDLDYRSEEQGSGITGHSK